MRKEIKILKIELIRAKESGGLIEKESRVLQRPLTHHMRSHAFAKETSLISTRIEPYKAEASFDQEDDTAESHLFE